MHDLAKGPVDLVAPRTPAHARPRSRPFAAQICVAFVLGLASILVTAVYWPGTIDSDTVGDLDEIASAHFGNWHAPVLEALWRIPYVLGLRSPGWILPVGIFTLLLGFYLVLRVRLSRASSTVLALLCLLFPPVLTWAIHIGADAWFAAGIICAFGFVARFARTTGRARIVSAAGAVWFAGIAMAARQNALPAVLVLFIALAAVAVPTHARRRIITVLGLGVLATVGVFLVEAGIQAAIGTRSTHPVQGTFIYDLAQLSKDEHRVLFPRSIDPGQSLTAISSRTTVYNTDGLLFGKPHVIAFPVEGKQYAALEKAWKSALVHYPSGWLAERGRLLLAMFSIGHPSYWLYDPPTAAYPPHFPSLNRDGMHYLSALAVGRDKESGDFLYDGWIYGLILLVGSGVLWRRTPAERVIAGLAITMLLYIVVLAFAGPGELYRYVYPMVAAGTVVLVLLLAGFVKAMAQRRWSYAR
jgi:hypothetical protein